MSNHETNLWPYSERSGVGAEAYVEELLQEPQVPLNEQDKAAVHEFAVGLFEGKLDETLRTADTSRSLEDINKTSVVANTQSFYLDYFETDNGREDLQKLGVVAEGPTEIPQKLYNLAQPELQPEPSVRKAVANRSRDWYKQELTGRLFKDPAEDCNQPDSDVVAVNFAPEKLLTKFAKFQEYRTFYRHVGHSLRLEEPSDVNAAKQTVLDIYFARVNGLVAGLYPSLNDLARQLSYMQTSAKTETWSAKLHDIAPVAATALAQDETARENYIAGFSRRLDLVRNGAAWRDGQEALPISHEIGALAEELSKDRNNPERLIAQLSPEVVGKLRQTRWNAEQQKTFCETMLAEWDLLSEHRSDWESVDERSGFAPDQKWQVVITPKDSPVDANGIKKVIVIPKKFDRTLTQLSPAGVLPVTAHELTHVLQTEYDQEVGESIPLARIRGRRFIAGREMGGIHQERELHTILGQTRPDNITYLRALEAKLSGANQTEVARAFINAKKSGERRASAGKNILRLYTNGGHNSQPLDYIEQALMLRSLENLSEEQVRAAAIAGGSFSLKDTAAFHRYGLLDLPEQVPHRPAQDVLRVFMERFYPSIAG